MNGVDLTLYKCMTYLNPVPKPNRHWG